MSSPTVTAPPPSTRAAAAGYTTRGVPKIIAIFVALLIALPFMGDLLNGYMGRIATRIISG